MRIGREGDSYSLPEERVARERRDTRCAPPRRRSVAFGQLRGSSAVDRANTAAPQPPGGAERARGVVGDEGGRMWALRRAYGAKERKRDWGVGSLTGMGRGVRINGRDETHPPSPPNIIIITGVTASGCTGTIPKER